MKQTNKTILSSLLVLALMLCCLPGGMRKATADNDDHVHDGITFQPLMSTTFPTDGKYYLKEERNFSLGEQGATITDKLNLCLNGKKITCSGTTTSGAVIIVSNGATLNLYDPHGSGRFAITAPDGKTASLRNYETVNIYSGTVSFPNKGEILNYGSMNMTGGSINFINDGEISGSGTMNMSGGSITADNNVVITVNSGIFTLSGGNIDLKNEAAIHVYNGGTFNLSGNPSIKGASEGILLESGGVININGKLTYNDPIIVQASGNPCVITSGYSKYHTEDPSVWFKPYNPNYKIVLSGSEALMTNHVHWIDYSISPDHTIIQAQCNNPDCYLTQEQRLLTISSPENPVYNGEAIPAKLSDGYSTEAFPNTEIVYSQPGSALKSAPVNAGTYVASVTAGTVTATTEYTIAKAPVTITVDAKTKVYGEKDPELTATVTGLIGSDKLNYTLSRTAGEDAGEYTITAVMGDNPNYDVTVKTNVFTITKANAAVATAPAAITGLTYTGTAQELITAGTAEGGEMRYALGTDTVTAPIDGWNTAIPTGTDELTYYVWYKTAGDQNHNDTTPVCLTVVIGEPPVPPTPPKTDLSGAKITADDQEYTGKTIQPKLTVTVGGKALSANTDYTAVFSNNKNIGKAAVTITGAGNYTGTASGTFNIIPKKVTSPKLKAGKKQLTLTWKAGKGIDGYEIEYGLKKTFKGSKLVTVKGAKSDEYEIKKLKAKKTYYVRIRTFKKVKGKKYYSAWSKILSKKTK